MNACWPFPGDDTLIRARKTAMLYREHLLAVAPDVCQLIDDTMLAYGQTWIVPDIRIYEDHDALTTGEAAVYASVRPQTIRLWACMPHPTDSSRKLLPRFGRRGRESTYLVVHIRNAAVTMEHNMRRKSRVCLTAV